MAAAASVLVVAVSRGAAQTSNGECPQIVRTALTATQNLCRGTGRNQICYGHSLLEVEPQETVEELNFDKPGDVVDALLMRALRVSEMNINSGYWGVALMRLQANLPDTLPGQNVTVLLFGDVEFRSAPSPSRTIDVIANETLTLRAGPTTTNLPVAYLEPGDGAVATGRLRDSSWLRVRLPGESYRSGWVVASLVTPVLGNLQTLDVVEPEISPPSYGPLQAFYLKTGVTEPACEEMPTNGLLIQTPRGAHDVSLVINDVEMTLGSTVFIEAAPGRSMSVMTIEGMARVSSNGEEQVAAPGAVVEVPVDQTLRPSGPPRRSRPYDRQKVEALPVEVLDEQVPVPPPLPIEAVERINQIVQEGEPLCGVPGLPSCVDPSVVIPVVEPTAGVATAEVTAELLPTNTPTATNTNTPTMTDTPAPSPTATDTPTNTPTRTPVPPELTDQPVLLPTLDVVTPTTTGIPVGGDPTNTSMPSGSIEITLTLPATATATPTRTPVPAPSEEPLVTRTLTPVVLSSTYTQTAYVPTTAPSGSSATESAATPTVEPTTQAATPRISGTATSRPVAPGTATATMTSTLRPVE